VEYKDDHVDQKFDLYAWCDIYDTPLAYVTTLTKDYRDILNPSGQTLV